MATAGRNLYANRSTLNCDIALEVLYNADSSEIRSVTIPVHGLILSACSPVFDTMLKSEMKEAESRVVRIEDSTPQAINTMIQYMYLENAYFASIPHCVHVCTAAHKFAVPGLIHSCEQYLIDRLANPYSVQAILGKNEFVLILELAETVENVELENNCFAFLSVFNKSIASQWGFPAFLTVSQKERLILFQSELIAYNKMSFQNTMRAHKAQSSIKSQS